MSANSHNVDICVTCICDKPPKLPLREELPSLGIEVIYNADGVGVEAAKKELRKERKKMHKQKMKGVRKQNKWKSEERTARSSRSSNPPGKSPFSFKTDRGFRPKKDPPEGLGIPKALSYGSYQRTLDIRTNDEAKSVTTSIETPSFMNEKPFRLARKKKLTKRLKGLFTQKKTPSSLPDAVEFSNIQHSPEEAALQEAFEAFMLDEVVDIPVKNSDEAVELFSDLLPSSKEISDHIEQENNAKSAEAKQAARATDSSFSESEQTTISSLGISSSFYKEYIVNDTEVLSKQTKKAFSKQAEEYLHQLKRVNSTTKTDYKSIAGKGNIRVKIFSNGVDDEITEIFDLTGISVSEKHKINMLSSKQLNFPGFLADDGQDGLIPPCTMDQNDQSHYSEESSVPVPRIHDQFGKSVLDVRNVYEENGPGSPLVLSPVSLMESLDFSLSPATFANPKFGCQKKNKRPCQSSLSCNPLREEDGFIQDKRDDIVVSRCGYDDMSSDFRERNLSPIKLGIASAYRTHSLEMKLQDFDEAMGQFISIQNRKTTTAISSPASKLIPILSKSASRGSLDSLKSSKSEDLVERNESLVDARISLPGSIMIGQASKDPIHFTPSLEADEAFYNFEYQSDIEGNPRSSQQILLEALSFGRNIPFGFEETIKSNPIIASLKLPSTDMYPLHLACSRSFPKRFAKNKTLRLTDLIHDLRMHRNLIEALVTADPEICRYVDTNGDLPAHIMARQLMEWEVQWYKNVYDKVKGQDKDKCAGSGLTILYQSMSESINILLKPIINNDSLCRQAGSIGRLLPLHIAAIFTVPYSTLKCLLETFPDAASIKCDLDSMKTFVPNNSTPLELHDKLSTDLPNWEIKRANCEPDQEMTQGMLDKIYETNNGIQRSDLIFAFFPNILPYRNQTDRVRRMEIIIQQEIKEQGNYDNFVLTRPAKAFWLWLCEFKNENNPLDHYARSVSRIINALPYNAVRFLATVLNTDGYPVIDGAISPCVDAIMDRLGEISRTEIPVRGRSLSIGSTISPKSSLICQFDYNISERLCFFGQGFVGPVCRTIFNISETTYPSNFVLLPYKLVKDEKGRLGLESAQAAKAAMKFAEFLSEITTPKNIIDVLDRKMYETRGKSLVVDRMSRDNRESHCRNDFTEFLKLYEDSPAYFYFIDDCTGVPIVDEFDKIYPLIISEAAEMVKKIFPMMLSGMILMRGEKAFSILLDVLLDEDIKLVLPHWIEGARDLMSFVLASQSNSTKPPRKDLLKFQQKLINFIQDGPTENEAINNCCRTNEWVIERSLLKMILETHDSKHYFCGLSKKQSLTQVLWTHETNIVDDNLELIDFQSPNSLKNLFYSEKIDIFGERGYEESFQDMDKLKASSYSRTPSEYSVEGCTDISPEEELPETLIASNMIESFDAARSYVSIDRLGQRTTYPLSNLEKKDSPNDNDNSLSVDSAVKLRLHLHEQEVRLNSLRQKIAQIAIEGDELEQQEEEATRMIDEIVKQKRNLESPTRDRFEKAKTLLMRICVLEDRVLCREVEVGQLKHKVSILQLEASGRTDSRELNMILPSSDHGVAYTFDNTSDICHEQVADPRVERILVRDEDIQSTGSHDLLYVGGGLQGTIHGDDSSAAHSTLYDSSMDGYSAEYSDAAGMPN